MAKLKEKENEWIDRIQNVMKLAAVCRKGVLQIVGKVKMKGEGSTHRETQ